ncbi:Methyltransferase FkbM domain-containing protein [Caenorhabditis elegans]|uniref:Methyltransferase FkbM domain-containing protein n=2 Tax=Caenorhabditis elegans TaxID=6239 RepID=Q9XWA5_CAEEL|nr:Methyltransferase FkbM domain-containing protein [Caenorhabditis elegans]CAA22061.1 Methyltransferase FkbM domain-containing protein [Caenorhabditis elegans]|eukprot:NP_001076727.1 Uncharacterized protein CELE_Y40H7A.4 [Caenorhabditis elegans]
MVAHFVSSKCAGYFLILVIFILFIANYYRLVILLETIEKLPPDTNYPNHQLLDSDSPIRELRRAALLSADQVQREIIENAVGEDNKNFYQKLRPEAFCPLKIKIGGKGDGGKIVCNPKAIKDDCTLMSLGLNNQVDYEQEIYNITGGNCLLLAADKDPQNMNTLRIFSTLKSHVYVGMIPDNLTIAHIMHSEYKTEVEILKIDIEGGEHTGLEQFLRDFFVCQILIEIHGWPPEHLDMLQKISRYGFRIFNIEPNRLCTRCAEYSFINELCMSQYSVLPLANMIPRNLTVV